MTAQLRVIDGGIADRNTVAAINSAMQLHAQGAKAPPRAAAERPKLSSVPLSCSKCGDPECKADPKMQDFLRITSAADVERDYADPIYHAAWVAYELHGVQCVARQHARMKMLPIGTVRPRDDGKWDEWTTAGWATADVVAVFVSVAGEYRDVLFNIVPRNGKRVAMLVPGQGLTEDETEPYEQAALAQWELERSL